MVPLDCRNQSRGDPHLPVDDWPALPSGSETSPLDLILAHRRVAEDYGTGIRPALGRSGYIRSVFRKNSEESPMRVPSRIV